MKLEPSDPSDSPKRARCTVFLAPEHAKHLRTLAEQVGMKPGALATALLEELLPTVVGVRRRLQIERNGGPPR